MEHFNTSNLDLKKDGWELSVNGQKELLQAKPGDIVKIAIAVLSPMDFEDEGPAQSAIHVPVWVEIEKLQDDGFVGKLKTKPGHEMQVKDGTAFEVGDEIFFKNQNILAIRG